MTPAVSHAKTDSGGSDHWALTATITDNEAQIGAEGGAWARRLATREPTP